MATKYARAGGGNWTADATWSTTSGGAADTVAPTTADDAVLDASSGNVTISATSVARSLDCTGYTGTLTLSASFYLRLGHSTAGPSNLLLKFSAGMTVAAGVSYLALEPTSATAQEVTWAGKSVFNVSQYLASSVKFLDAYSGGGLLQLWEGTLDTNSQNVVSGSFDTSTTGTRTLTLGSSAITLSSTSTAWSAATVTNLTVSANTATVTCTGAAATFSGGAKDWNGLSVVMSGSGAQNVTAGGTLANFTRTGTAVKTDSLTLTTSGITCTGTCTLTGNSATNRILVASAVLGTARTITAATTSLTNVDFRDITGAGAATWSGTSIGNALGNTGITFTTPVTRYAVATGNVSGTGTWSDTSGGASGASVPLPQDTMVLNAASGAITVTNDMPRMCADLTCTGFTGTFTNSATTEVYGNPTFASGMTVSGTSRFFLCGRSSQLVTSAGKTLTWPVDINTAGGTYTLADALTTSASTNGALRVTSGGFSDSGFSIVLTGVGANFDFYSASATLSGTTTIAGTTNASPWLFSSGTLTHTGTIVLSGATATDRTFAGGDKTYGTLTDQNTSTGKLTITGANTFGTINKTAAAACTLALPTSSGITVTGEFLVRGISGAVLTLTGDVTKAGGTVSCDYLAISSSDAAGGATFYAGANSTDGGTNTGWIFGAPTGGRPYKGGAATVTSPAGADTVTTIEGALVVL